MVGDNKARRGDSACGDLAWKLSSLISRVEKATGPDRRMDGDIHNALFGVAHVYAPFSVTGFLTSKDDNGCPQVPGYTTSIDAAVALADRVLPGVELEITNLYGVARVALHHETGQFYGSSAINSLPMALVLATLSALQSQTGDA